MNWGDAACMFNWIMLVVLAVHDLERTAQRLGDWFCLRFSSYGRPFPGAIHCLAHTDFGFLELSTVEDYRQITKTDLGRMLADFLEKNEGVFSAALETRDIWKVAENCRKEGASVSTPKRSETVLNFRRTEGSPVQISDSSSVGAGEQERHTDREEVQEVFWIEIDTRGNHSLAVASLFQAVAGLRRSEGWLPQPWEGLWPFVPSPRY